MSCQDRFEDKYIPVTESGCWIWTGAAYLNGYGQFFLNKFGIAVTGAHRAGRILFKGETPKDMRVCHTCDVPCCVNPAHLFLGTAADNTHDMYKKGRNSKHYPTSPLGEKNHQAVLTEKIVKEMREIKGKSSYEIAKEYGVSQMTAYRAINRISWRHVK